MRYETKIVVAESDLSRARTELQLLPAALSTLYPDRIVQSIYFDTPDGRAVEESLAGISVRHKLRWRWYGDRTDAAEGQFECKRRVSTGGLKDVESTGESMAIAGVDRRRFTDELATRLPGAFAAELRGTEPVQWIRYQRQYLGSADGDLRVTLDRGLTAYDQRIGPRLQCTAATPLPRIGIIEIKADADKQPALERFLQGVGWRSGRCSKFMIASCPGEIDLVTRWADE